MLVSTFVSAHRCRVTGDAIFKITRHTEGKERIMQKRRKFSKKSVCRALKTYRKWQVAHEIHKIVGVMHTIFLLTGPWRPNVRETRATGYF